MTDFSVTVKVDFNLNDFLQPIETASRNAVKKIGDIMASNFTNVAGRHFDSPPSTTVSISSGFEGAIASVTWGSANDPVAGFSSGQYQPVLPEDDASEPVGITQVNQSGSAALFPSKPGSKEWSMQLVLDPDPKPRNYEEGNVNYTLENNLSEILQIVGDEITKAYR